MCGVLVVLLWCAPVPDVRTCGCVICFCLPILYVFEGDVTVDLLLLFAVVGFSTFTLTQYPTGVGVRESSAKSPPGSMPAVASAKRRCDRLLRSQCSLLLGNL